MDVDPERVEARDVDVDPEVELAVLDEVGPADIPLDDQLLLLGQLGPALDHPDAGAARTRRLHGTQAGDGERGGGRLMQGFGSRDIE